MIKEGFFKKLFKHKPSSFKEGDILIFKSGSWGCMGLSNSRVGKKCVIVEVNGYDDFRITFLGIDDDSVYFCRRDNLEPLSDEFYKKQEDLKKIDPYGEENRLDESIELENEPQVGDICIFQKDKYGNTYGLSSKIGQKCIVTEIIKNFFKINFEMRKTPSAWDFFVQKDNLKVIKSDTNRIYSEEDPYGEEDWTNEEFSAKPKPKYKKGDAVYFISNFEILKKYIGIYIIIDRIYRGGEYWYHLKNLKKGLNWIKEDNLCYKQKDKNVLNIARGIRKEKLEKKLARKRKIEQMKDIDPYGEEDWTEDILERKVTYKKQLCPDLWEGDKLKERIRKKLHAIAMDFYNDMEIEVELLDIYLTGSIANYNYSSASDIDVHIVIDYSEVNDDIELVEKAVDGIRHIWNIKHNIVIQGHDVELYVQNSKGEHTSSGVYSIMNDEWIIKPVYNKPIMDQKDVDEKYDVRVSDIERFYKISKMDLSTEEATEYYKAAKQLKKKIMRGRQEGLHIVGEFSLENLVFKKLRKTGKFKKLMDTVNRLYDKIYSQ